MNLKYIKKKNEKLILELNYLFVDLEYHEEVYKEAQEEFKKSFYEEAQKLNLNVKKPENNNTTTETGISTIVLESDNTVTDPIEEVEEENDDNIFTSLFKKIVKLTHPDIYDKNDSENTKEKKLQTFLKAKKAVDTKSWYDIQKIALELGIELPEPSKEQIKWLEKEITRIKERITFITSTYAWVWFHKEENKESMMHDYFKVVKLYQ
jgi:rRNA maturation endonuclease Nob1